MVFRFSRKQKNTFLLGFITDPKIRPPVLDEMMPDIERVIATTAHKYCDTTTPHLQFDELVGDGKLKLAEVITSGRLDSIETRWDFFRFFASCVNNQARSKVQKYRFTEKRTGVKPPPREKRFEFSKPVEDQEDEPVHEYHKNVELSLDDPDLNLQVPDGAHFCDRSTRDVEEEYRVLLSPVERMVFNELIAPCDETRCAAWEDAHRGRLAGDKLSVKIKVCHMAEGLDMSPKEFEKYVLSIRKKISAYRMMTEQQEIEQNRRNASISQLKLIFGLQIPPNCDDMIVRRMLTMAARDQYEKVNAQVSEMLMEVGAKPPRKIGTDKMACYGVLYQKNNRTCNVCDLRHSCAVEAANMGLTKMTFSPKLLGTKQPRIPAFLPRMSNQVNPRISASDEAEILAHIEETFERTERNGMTFFYHSIGTTKKRRYLFCIESSSPLKLRFCNPSVILKKRLIGKQKTWCPREIASMSEIIELVEQHAKETYE